MKSSVYWLHILRHRTSHKIMLKYCIFGIAYAFCLKICIRFFQRVMPTCLSVYNIISIYMHAKGALYNRTKVDLVGFESDFVKKCCVND